MLLPESIGWMPVGVLNVAAVPVPLATPVTPAVPAKVEVVQPVPAREGELADGVVAAIGDEKIAVGVEGPRWWEH